MQDRIKREDGLFIIIDCPQCFASLIIQDEVLKVYIKEEKEVECNECGHKFKIRENLLYSGTDNKRMTTLKKRLISWLKRHGM